MREPMRVTRVLRNLLAAIGALWVLVTVTPVTRWYASALAGPWQDPPGEILLVLGADDPNYGFIGEGSYWRAMYAVLAWRQGHFQEMVISGGSGVAQSMKDFVVYYGVPASQIVLETRSRSTRENALFTAPILRTMPGRVVLLTSDFHVFRSVRAFDKAGVPVRPEFFPYVLKSYNSWQQRWPMFLVLVLESAKIVYYRARGWI